MLIVLENMTLGGKSQTLSLAVAMPFSGQLHTSMAALGRSSRMSMAFSYPPSALTFYFLNTSSPVDGIYGSTVAIPKGVMKIVTGVQEGFHNAPKLYGSEVREKRRPKDLSSGIVEAGKVSTFYVSKFTSSLNNISRAYSTDITMGSRVYIRSQ
jgi:hypothetical protein